jgi:hypothetical protein
MLCQVKCHYDLTAGTAHGLVLFASFRALRARQTPFGRRSVCADCGGQLMQNRNQNETCLRSSTLPGNQTLAVLLSVGLYLFLYEYQGPY